MTVSSTTGQTRGSFPAPPAASAPFPTIWSDDFEGSEPETLGKYWADQCGSFQVMPTDDGSSGKALRQRVTEKAGVNQWAGELPNPITTLGNPNSTNQVLKARVRVPAPTAALLVAPDASVSWKYEHGQVSAVPGTDWVMSGQFTLAEAEALCAKTVYCQAITYDGPVNATKTQLIWLTSKTEISKPPDAWHTYILNPPHKLPPKPWPGPPPPPPPSPPPPTVPWVGLCGRVSNVSPGKIYAVCLELVAASPTAMSPMAWQLIETKTGTVLSNGTTTESLEQWHALELSFSGAVVTASIDGEPVGHGVTKSPNGMAGLASGWHVAEFDEFHLTAALR